MNTFINGCIKHIWIQVLGKFTAMRWQECIDLYQNLIIWWIGFFISFKLGGSGWLHQAVDSLHRTIWTESNEALLGANLDTSSQDYWHCIHHSINVKLKSPTKCDACDGNYPRYPRSRPPATSPPPLATGRQSASGHRHSGNLANTLSSA